MKYRFGNRCLQALLMLGLCGSAWGQTVSAPPLQTSVPQVSPPLPQASPPLPVISPEAVVPGPVTAPVEPLPTPAPKKVKKSGPVDGLKPGQFVWEKRDVYEGPLKIVAVLDIQRMYVFQNDKLVGFTTISAGKKGKETPTGVFNILQKNIDHKSNLYSNAPMPYMQRLTWDGIALHGGHIPGYPASHGCIRMPHAFAKALYEVTQMAQEVVVLKDTETPVKRPEPKPVPVIEPPVVPIEPVSVDPSVPPPASPAKQTPL